MLSIQELTSRYSKNGRLEWIGVRPARDQSMLSLPYVEIEEKGLTGDRTMRANARSVTLVQFEHLPVIASLSDRESIEPSDLRRNLVVSGINLLALRDKSFKVGSVVLEGTGICAPCSKMEKSLGHGAYNAMRGHGGITARVITGGQIELGDSVEVLSP